MQFCPVNFARHNPKRNRRYDDAIGAITPEVAVEPVVKLYLYEGLTVPVVRSPVNALALVAGDPGRSRSAYCPARPFNRPVTRRVQLPSG